MNAQQVTLEPSSLYVFTQPLLHGAFHWAFIHTDAHNHATIHHWAEQDRGPYAESYRMQDLAAGTNKLRNAPVLGYFKVEGYAAVDLSIFAHICQDTFPSGWTTVQQNRARGLSCRTWVVAVLAGMKAQRLLSRRDSAEDIERAIKTRSAEFDVIYMNDFLWQRAYQTVVTSI